MIASGVMLYTENILDEPVVKKTLSIFHIKYDLHKVIPQYGEVINLVYAYEVVIAPLIIIFASRMRVSKWAFLFPLYAYISALIGTILTSLGYKIFDIWLYRLAVLPAVILVWWIHSKSMNYFEACEKEEELRDLILENYRLKLRKDEAA